MTLTVTTQLVYLAISIALTIWVARTLHKHGRVFLFDCFHRNAELTDSINHLLVVGFYLVNIGFVSLFLKYGIAADTVPHAIETLSTKVGIVLVVLGAMHFLNIKVFSGMRKTALGTKPNGHGNPPPPLPAAKMMAV